VSRDKSNRRFEGYITHRHGMSIQIGLAMLQGARHEHAQAILGAAKELGVDVEVKILREAEDLITGIDALVLPGGESTTMRIASRHSGLLDALYQVITNNPELPVLGTCAGAILMCSPNNDTSPLLDATISRNAWGRQVDSFQSPIDVKLDSEYVEPKETGIVVTDSCHMPLAIEKEFHDDEATFPGIFIRAPRFSSVGKNASVIAELNGEVVGVRQDSRIGLTFHPELTSDRRFHRWIISKAISRSVEMN
tara:strand:- start:258 stop:1010 length:753 start_codon:yes stop_codon:yes gene_type:complete